MELRVKVSLYNPSQSMAGNSIKQRRLFGTESRTTGHNRMFTGSGVLAADFRLNGVDAALPEGLGFRFNRR